MPSTRPLPEQLESLISRCQVSGKIRGEILDLFVRGCRRRGLKSFQLTMYRALVRGLSLCRPRRLTSWDTVAVMKAEVPGLLAIRSDKKLFGRALTYAAEQLVFEGGLEPRLRHRQRAPCSRCGQTRRIENVKHRLCAACVGEATLQERFDRRCHRYSFADAGRSEIFEALVEYEQRQPASLAAFNRVWGLGGFLSEVGPVPALRTWGDVADLREAIKADRMRGRAHQAMWALYKVCEVLIERGTLDVRPPKTTGSLPDQIEAIATYFYVEDPYRQELLRLLIDYYHDTRVTITAVLVVQAFAYHLARSEVPTIESWDDIHTQIRQSPDPPERWHCRIKTAWRRLGDALERAGKIAPHPDRDAVQQAIIKLETTDKRLRDINVRFLTSLHEHGRRPITLQSYVANLNRFWTWLASQSVNHPAQVSAELFLGYLRALGEEGGSPSQLQRSCTCLRGYFKWLRRERLVLTNPVPPPGEPAPTIVRVCETGTFEKLIAALGDNQLPARDAMILYLLIFHGLRNYEVVRAIGVGFRGRGNNATFAIELPELVASAGHSRPSRRDLIVQLPTGRHPWLHNIVIQMTEERAHILKDPDTPYLLVSPSWRRGTEPQDPHVVSYAVDRISRSVCGIALTPRLVRQTAAAYFADQSDHTVCSAMGWGTARAVDLAYATREVVARSPEP